MMEAAQLDKMDLHSFLGLDLPAALPHHSLLANGDGLLGDCCGPAFLDDSPNTSVGSLNGSGSSAFPFEGELGDDLGLPFDKRSMAAMPPLEQSQVSFRSHIHASCVVSNALASLRQCLRETGPFRPKRGLVRLFLCDGFQ